MNTRDRILPGPLEEHWLCVRFLCGSDSAHVRNLTRLGCCVWTARIVGARRRYGGADAAGHSAGRVPDIDGWSPPSGAHTHNHIRMCIIIIACVSSYPHVYHHTCVCIINQIFKNVVTLMIAVGDLP